MNSKPTYKELELRVRELESEVFEYKRIEEETQRLAKLPDKNPNPALRISKVGTVDYANEAAAPLLNMWGCQVNQPLPDEYRRLITDVIGSGSDRVADIDCENRIFSLTFANAGAADYVNVYGIDVTDRKRVGEALMESEVWMKTIFNAILTGIVIIDMETHKIIDVNTAAINMIGAPKEQIVGMKCHQYICPSQEGACPITDLGQEIDTSERILLTADGNEIPIIKTVTPVILGRREYVLESFIDITKRKELETQLDRARKLETIGTVVGGVAHDLNNVLTGIVSFPDLVLMQLPDDSPLRKPILIMKSAGEKAANIVQDLQILTRSSVTVTKVVNLNDIVCDYLKTPEHQKIKLFHPDVRFEIDLEENLLNIMGSPVHLSKTIMNLMSNASEALSAGGKVFLSTRNQYIDRPITGYEHVKKGEYITLTITDNGIGISEEDLNKIFEPFYTKKVMGRSGTGLGMTLVWGTVKDHDGYVDIQSTVGKGTTITLYFPITRKERAEDITPLVIADHSGMGETVLIVDDQEMQREITSSMLKNLGYTVTSVSSGEEAIEYMKSNSVDLLILDMIMDPGIDGLETYKRILEIHPGQKAFIVSGFSETERVKEAQRLGAGTYIKKPFTLEQLGIAVRHELEG